MLSEFNKILLRFKSNKVGKSQVNIALLYRFFCCFMIKLLRLKNN